MNKVARRGLMAALAAALLVAPALADVTEINSVKIEERIFNDYPNSTLVSTNNYPALVSFVESNFGDGGWANMHCAWFSADGGASRRAFLGAESFDISTTVYLDAGSTAPRKESGFRYTTPNIGEGLFMVAADGEVAAFGANLPFYTFGGGAYALGTTATLRMIYRAGGTPTMEYIFNGLSSGPLPLALDYPVLIDGSNLGLYLQNAVDDSNPSEFGLVEYGNITVDVPEPAAAVLLALAALAVRRRARAG